jgi:hypothetical protein
MSAIGMPGLLHVNLAHFRSSIRPNCNACLLRSRAVRNNQALSVSPTSFGSLDETHGLRLLRQQQEPVRPSPGSDSVRRCRPNQRSGIDRTLPAVLMRLVVPHTRMTRRRLPDLQKRCLQRRGTDIAVGRTTYVAVAGEEGAVLRLPRGLRSVERHLARQRRCRAQHGPCSMWPAGWNTPLRFVTTKNACAGSGIPARPIAGAGSRCPATLTACRSRTMSAPAWRGSSAWSPPAARPWQRGIEPQANWVRQGYLSELQTRIGWTEASGL